MIQIKRSETAGAAPTAGQLAVGQPAANLVDGIIYSKTSGGTVVPLSVPPAGYPEVTVTDKNKKIARLRSGATDFLVDITYRWNGSAWESDLGVGLGNLAAEQNSGRYLTAVGYAAGRYNSGVNCVEVGYAAGQNNSGANCVEVGYAAGQNNSGVNCVEVGYLAGLNNSGANCVEVGYLAGQNNSGATCVEVGHYAGRYNSGANCVEVGSYAGQNNSGVNCVEVGYAAGQYNSGATNISLGYNCNASFLANASAEKAFADIDVNAALDRVTITAHGFGATGSFVSLLFTQGTAAIGGLVNGGLYKAKIIDSNTLGLNEGAGTSATNITSAAGTGHKLTPQYIYDNVTLIGANLVPTKAGQVVIGGTSQTETKLNTTLGVGGVEPATALDVNGAITLRERSTAPSDPLEGRSVLWLSDGTGGGGDGDLMVKITAGGVTKTVTLVDFSAA